MKVLLVSEGKHELGGALETLVKRLIAREATYGLKNIRDHDLRAHAGKGPGYFKKALRCVIYAEEEDYDAVVMVIDQDDDPTRRRQIDDAQDHLTMTQLPRALGVAVRTFDAWMLADEQALTSVLGTQVQRQPDPEDIPDPKEACQAHHDTSSFGHGLSQLYAEVAAAADLDVLAVRCPLGFAPFANRVRAI